MSRTVVHFTDTPGFGGAEQMLLTMLAGLECEGWHCILVHHRPPAPRHGTGAAQLVETAERLGIEARSVVRESGRWGGADLSQLVRTLRGIRPAIFHAHLIWALRCTRGVLAARLAGTAGVVATQQLYPDALTGRQRVKQRLVSTVVDRYIAVSHAMARSLRRHVAFGGRVAVIHNAVDVGAFERYVSPAAVAHLRAGLPGGATRPIVLTLARLNQQKGLEHLIAAAALVPDARFLIAGEGHLRGSLEAAARGRGLAERVVFLGHRADVRELLAACDVFVLPSLYEGLPVSVLEAMAALKPVVATAIGGTEEAVLHGETGLLVPAADAPALAAAVRSVLEDRALAGRLAAAGHERARRHFSTRTMIERLTALYDQVLGERHARAA